jgi:hypothetical protein
MGEAENKQVIQRAFRIESVEIDLYPEQAENPSGCRPES